ncbi:MAG TPA: hypothetical protein VFC90_06550 [Planctomycetota bacterium]|nr:hypothetical protein [Planctomycetota bacterium]
MHKSKTAIEASLKVVNVVGILDLKHGSTTVMVNGRKEKRCSIVPAMTCEEHFKIADYAFLNGYDSVTGQVFVNVWNSLAKKPSKPVGNPGAEGYVQIVDEAIRKIDGTIILKPDYDAWAIQMDAARVAQEKKDVRKAIDILSKQTKNEIAKLAGLAEERLRAVNEEGSSLVAEAEKQAKENLAWSKETLKRVIREYAPLDCSKTATIILKRLEEKGR